MCSVAGSAQLPEWPAAALIHLGGTPENFIIRQHVVRKIVIRAQYRIRPGKKVAMDSAVRNRPYKFCRANHAAAILR
jgi:hypothetical protein